MVLVHPILFLGTIGSFVAIIAVILVLHREREKAGAEASEYVFVLQNIRHLRREIISMLKSHQDVLATAKNRLF